MRPGADAEPIVLSTLEFDVACESEGLTERRHIVLTVPSPGATHTERAELLSQVWPQLRSRKLAEPGKDRLDEDFADLLVLLDRPQLAVDLRIWAPDRSIRALGSANGNTGLVTIVDGDVVELAPVRGSSLPEAVVSVAGDGPPGGGRPVSVPHDVLMDASARAGQDMRVFADELRGLGVEPDDAEMLSRMADGMGMRGQFGVEHTPSRSAKPVRSDRVVGFHDTPAGRYLHSVRASGDGRQWSTVAPCDNQRLAEYLRELITDTVED
ncbi:ESX secretion-associated protein EspG [Saccharopolyspora gloriosae]|uniref:ESX secretion-associated protein EspG n=1 Tax=Saccharopolyspora gloriosae TaxID=455344 RepID=UPI001FB6FC85|nr:ESX secretion-associated protein EspG [Saccharopolyspora gloriosae]